MATTDRRGVSVDATDTPIAGDPNPGLAIKAPARAATTANITLSGLQTVDGVALAAGDRVLVKNQTDGTQNGVYKASTGNWTRDVDFDGNGDIVSGTRLLVTSGGTYQRTEFAVTSADPITIGASPITFAVLSTNITFTYASYALAAGATAPSVVSEITTQGYAAAGDGGGATYKRVGSQPSHPGRLQTADGAWWEYADPKVQAAAFGLDATVNDNHIALQNSLDTAYAQNKIVTMPALPAGQAAFKTSRLTYKFQTIIGPGRDYCTIEGLPGQDVFYTPDPSIAETGSLAAFNKFHIEGITIQVDSSGSPAFTRPIYPIKEAWVTGHTYAAGDWVTGAGGNVYYCWKTGGVAGASQPSHTSALASDGVCNWLYVDGAQRNVQNVAFAFPFYDGSASPANTEHSIFPLFRDVIILDNQAGSNFTGGFWTQRSPYEGRFLNCHFYFCGFNFANVPPTINFGSMQIGPDTLVFDSCSFGGRGSGHISLVVYNAAPGAINNCNFYIEGVQNRGIYILNCNGPGRTSSFDYTITGLYAEGNNATTGPMHFIMGDNHVLHGGMTIGMGATSFIAWAGSNGSMDNVIGALGGSTAIEIYGNFNRMRGTSLSAPNSAILDLGVGNDVQVASSASTPMQTDRPILASNRTRLPLKLQRSDFAQGFVATPFQSFDDLLIGYAEPLFSTITGLFQDSTLETGGYVRVSAASYSTNISGLVHTFGDTRFPARKCRIYVKARASTSLNCQIGMEDLGTATVYGPTCALTTSWAVFSADADFSALSGHEIEAIINTFTGGQTVDLAWIAIRPVPAETLTSVAEIAGATSGSTKLVAAAVASGTVTLPSVTDTIAMLGASQIFSGRNSYFPSATFATLPAASSNSGVIYNVTDVGVNGSLWQSNGTAWCPVAGTITLYEGSIPFIIPAGNGSTIGWKTDAALTTGTFSMTTALLANTYANCYMYFPANFGGSSLAAGWYFVQMSSTSAGVVYNNTYTSGVPTIPASPTAFAGGTFTVATWLTQNVAGYHLGPNVTLPGNVLGKNGRLAARFVAINNNSANAKYSSFRYAGNDTGVALTMNPTTQPSQPMAASYTNVGATNAQIAVNDVFASAGVSSALALDSTSSQTVGIAMLPNNNTDIMGALAVIITVTPSAP